MSARSMKLIGLPSAELLRFLFEYVTWPCDLDLWPYIKARGATRVVNLCTKDELDMTYDSNVKTTTIFHWPWA